MAFSSVSAVTTISSSLNSTAILAAMETAYNGSTIAKAMFDDWIATPGHTIVINFVSGVFQAYGNTGILEIDPSFLTDNTYISSTGEAVADTLLSALIHELGHALKGYVDGHNVQGDLPYFPANDFMGVNVAYVNTIYQQLGIDEQVSYVAYDPNGSLLQEGYEYTGSAAITGAWVNDINMTTGSTDDLLVGGASNNYLVSGAGNDFLYGAGGLDTFSPGAGNDLIHGGGPDNPGADAKDTVDYSIGNTTSSGSGFATTETPSGITVDFNFNTGTTIDSRKVFTVNNDGYGGTDRLVSIETVIGTSHDDTFKIEGLVDTYIGYRFTLNGNGADDADTLDFSGSSTGYFISLNESGAGWTYAVDSSAVLQGGVMEFVGLFADVLGSDQSDFLKVFSDGATVDGGDGNDFIIARSPGGDVLGGAGVDRMVISSGQTVDGGGDDDIYVIQGDGTIKFGAGSGNEVLRGGGCIVDFGNIASTEISIAWAAALVSEDLDLGSGMWTKHFDGDIEIVLGSGDSIRVEGTKLSGIKATWSEDLEGTPPGEYTEKYANISLQDPTMVSYKFSDGTFHISDLLINLGYAQEFTEGDYEYVEGYYYPIQSIMNANLAAETVHSGPDDKDWIETYFGKATNSAPGSNPSASLEGSSGDDLFAGGYGSNSVTYENAGASVEVSLRYEAEGQDTGGAGIDTLIDISTLIGSGYADVLETGYGYSELHGGDGNDSLAVAGVTSGAGIYGDAGDDEIQIFSTNNVIDGGEDTDEVIYAQSFATFSFSRQYDGSIAVSISDGLGGFTLSDVLSNIENYSFSDTLTPLTAHDFVADYGTSGNDVLLSGTAGSDNLYGLSGDDALEGYAGDDFVYAGQDDDEITGGAGNDILVGGSGNDIAYFSGNISDYTIDRTDDGVAYTYTVTDNNALDDDDGVDTVMGVETLTFLNNGGIADNYLTDNHTPVAYGQNTYITMNEAFMGYFYAVDGEGDQLIYSILDGPDHGDIDFDPDTGEFTYTPDTDYTGDDSFTFAAYDGHTTSTGALFELSILG